MSGLSMFHNEDEFQAFFIEHFASSYLGNNLYAKTTRIAGEFIQPEIDLLDITPLRPGQIVSAYEFKVLNCSRMGDNYSRIYAGIGQAVSYFKYGVDQSYLVIGISDDVSTANSFRLRGNIRLLGNFVSQLHIDRFQVVMYDESLNEIWDIPYLSPSGRFERDGIPRDFVEPIELARDNILAGNFTKRKGNNFFRRYELDQYVT